MILADAGPLVAVLDRRDPHHRRCMEVAPAFSVGPLLTTWPCFAEAMYLLHSRGGYRYQEALWEMYGGGGIQMLDLTPAETLRMADLMARYRDVPMDLADASLVVAAERRSERRIFTLDSHFWTYRLSDGSALEPIPGR